MAALAALTTDLTRETGLQIATTSYWNIPHETGAFAEILDTQTGVQHACEAETSRMMAVRDDSVRRDRLDAALGPYAPMGAALGGALTLWRSCTDKTPSGVLGDARVASAEKGEKLLDSAAQSLAEELLSGKHWS